MKRASSFALVMLLSAGQIQAQGNSAESENIEEVLITGQLSAFGATKTPLPILETARSISIETEQMFTAKGALTLDDALGYTAGVVGDTFGFSTRGDFPKIRGFDAAEYRDGQQVLFGFYNNTRSDIYMLEQVEVLKGPASVLYGKGTPGGVVNAISKLAGPEQDSEIQLQIGTESRRQLAVDYNAELGSDLFGRVVALVRESDTQVDYVNDDSLTIMPSVTWQTETSRVSAMVELVDRESDTSHQFLPITATGCASGDVSITPATVCSASTGQEIDASSYHGEPSFNRYDTESTLFSVMGEHQLTDTVWVEAIGRYKDADVDYRQTWIRFQGDGVPRIAANGDSFARSWYKSDAATKQTAVDLRLRWELEIGPIEHQVLVGIGYQDVSVKDDYLFDVTLDPINVYAPIPNPSLVTDFTGPFVFASNVTTETTDQAIYISDQISIDAFKINLGLRYDEVETQATGGVPQKDSELSLSGGVLYAFESGVSPYISYSESFNPVIGTDGFTNNTLKPQVGEQFEAGIKYQPTGTKTYLTFAYFDVKESNLSNPAALLGQPNSQQEGEANVDGVELELITYIGDWSIEANLSKIDTADVNDFAFASIPETQASTWFQYEPSSEGLRAGFGLRYISENESNGANLLTGEAVRVVTDGVTVADAMVGYRAEQWDMQVNMRNVGDEEYYGTCLARGDCFPGERRTVVGTLTKAF